MLSVRTIVAASFVAGAFADCWDENKCIFHQYTGGVIDYSWDLRSLCNNGQGYTFVNATTGQTYRFEICGSIDAQVTPPTSTCGGPGSTYPCTIPGAKQTNTYCNPEYNSYPFEGNFLQFFDPNPFRDCNRGACPNTGFLSPSLQNQQGYCCTGQCEIIAYGNAAYNYRWIDNNNVATGGIRWTAYGDAPDNGDEFQCPIDPFTGNPRARTLQVNMRCNPNGKRSDPLQTIAFYDNGSCYYTVIMSHFAACATAGDPFEGLIPAGILSANYFGYTCLGLFLAVVIYYVYAFGDDKGWWDPIKNALPTFTIPFIGTFNAKGGVYGGSGYKSTTASAPLATPSVYGST